MGTGGGGGAAAPRRPPPAASSPAAPACCCRHRARSRKKRLTVVDKANVLDTSRLWRKVAQVRRGALRRTSAPPSPRAGEDVTLIVCDTVSEGVPVALTVDDELGV